MNNKTMDASFVNEFIFIFIIYVNHLIKHYASAVRAAHKIPLS